MKRPILIAVIGYILGIIWGIYNKSIFPFWFTIIAMYYLSKKVFKSKRKFKILSVKRYLRYTKLYLNKTSLILIILISLISNGVVIYYNYKYDKFYNQDEKIEVTATVVSNKVEKEYNNMYIIKLEKNDIYVCVYANKNINLEYGDKINIKGTYVKPEIQRNYKGFDYSKFLKSKKNYGSIKSNNIKILSKNNINFILKYANRIHIFLNNKISENMPKDCKDIFLGLVLGDTNNIEDDIIENFRTSSISHVLAISGMHISYIIMGVNLLFKKLFGYRLSKYITIFILIIYMLIVGFSPSIVRAGIMGVLTILASITYRKSDTLTNIGLSALILLIYNPFIIYDLGFQFSYAGTMGILLFNKNIFNALKSIKNQYKKSIFDNKLGESISVIIAAQILILIISILHYNILGLYFIITNLLTSIIIGPIIIIGIVYVFILIINTRLANLVGIILNFFIKVLISISNFSSLPFAKIYVTTPNFICVITYLILILLIQFLYYIYHSKKQNETVLRFRNTIALIKYKLKSKEKILKIIFALFLIIFILYSIIPQNLKMNFVDVGQGDCTFIVTPKKHTILIDGGGSEFSSFDVGKSVLLPYILDRGYTKLDYVFISHFDSDHIGGILTILKELKVKNVIISRQGERSENYDEFIKIIKEKRIKLIIVEVGDTINIEKNVHIKILWPESKLVSDNILNNNSIVMKLNYYKFSCLFTGDIEETAENKIVEKYIHNELKANIIKIAHHGSKTSTTDSFLKEVKPKIALIGVEKNNKFGHPSDEVINLLEKQKIKIYRTDLNGEICMKINKNGGIKINSQIK